MVHAMKRFGQELQPLYSSNDELMVDLPSLISLLLDLYMNSNQSLKNIYSNHYYSKLLSVKTKFDHSINLLYSLHLYHSYLILS